MASTETDIRRQIAAGPDKPDTYLELASFLFRRQRFEESIATLRQGLAVVSGDVNRASLLISYGWYLFSIAGDVIEPKALGEQALALTQGDDKRETLLARAKAQGLISEFGFGTEPGRAAQLAESALSLFYQVLREDMSAEPTARWEALTDSARLECLLGRFDEALEWAQMALKSTPDKDAEGDSLTELGAIQRQARRFVEARETLSKAIRLPNAAPFLLTRTYFELSLTELALGKAAEARAKLRRAIEIIQDDAAIPKWHLPELLRLSGDISYDMADFEEAARSFRAATEAYAITEPPYWTSLLWLAYCQIELGEVQSARTNAERVSRSLAASDDERKKAIELLAETQSVG